MFEERRELVLTVKIEINFHQRSMSCCNKRSEELLMRNRGVWSLCSKTESESIDDSHLGILLVGERVAVQRCTYMPDQGDILDVSQQ